MKVDQDTRNQRLLIKLLMEAESIKARYLRTKIFKLHNPAPGKQMRGYFTQDLVWGKKMAKIITILNQKGE